MNWYEILGCILGGAGGLYTLYTMGVNKESIAIKNLRETLTEVQDSRDKDREYFESIIAKLEEKINRIELRAEIQDRAINAGHRCRLPQDGAVCPVIEMMDKACNSLSSKCQHK